MSIWATILVLDDDHTDTCTAWQQPDLTLRLYHPTGPCGCGRPNQPYRYRGSHILPAPDDPRGGSVQLAEVPSHITRDGRDDVPADDTPWPWLRLSTTDPDTILNPPQARQLADALTGWLATQPDGTEDPDGR